MPAIEDNKLAQLSMPDILLKLFVFTAVPINPSSGLLYWSRCCISTAKTRLPALKERNKRKENTLAYGEVQGDSEMIWESMVDSSLNIRAASVFL